MKAQEMRIGNWAMGNKPFKVTGNDISLAQLSEATQGNERWSSIPLTEEWLERLGFDSKGRRFGYQVCTTSLNAWIIDDGISVIGVEFDYVHQLQNLYFALTGVEL